MKNGVIRTYNQPFDICNKDIYTTIEWSLNVIHDDSSFSLWASPTHVSENVSDDYKN